MKLTDSIKNKICVQKWEEKKNDRKRDENAGVNKFTERTQIIIMTIIYFCCQEDNNYALHRQMIIVDVCPDNKYGTVRKKKKDRENRARRIIAKPSFPFVQSFRIYLYNRAIYINYKIKDFKAQQGRRERERERETDGWFCARMILRASQCCKIATIIIIIIYLKNNNNDNNNEIMMR